MSLVVCYSETEVKSKLNEQDFDKPFIAFDMFQGHCILVCILPFKLRRLGVGLSAEDIALMST